MLSSADMCLLHDISTCNKKHIMILILWSRMMHIWVQLHKPIQSTHQKQKEECEIFQIGSTGSETDNKKSVFKKPTNVGMHVCTNV